MSTAFDLCGSDKGSRGRGWRQFAVAAATLSLAACSSGEAEKDRGTIGFVQGFLGGVVADEPRAAMIGRDVLSAGGSAADAAVATYFALAVTMPSSAGIGGGGVCVSFHRTDKRTSRTESLEFLARAPRAAADDAQRPNAIPGNPRGMFALHSRSGRLKWAQLVGPAENLARFGTPVSRALAADLRLVGPALLADPGARAVFARADGKLVGEGDTVRQVDLAATLGRLRTQGPGELYVGAMARPFVEAVGRAGGSLTVEDLRENVPVWRDTARFKIGNNTVHVAPPPPAGGLVAAQMLGALSARDGFAEADGVQRLHALADSALLAYAERSRWLGRDGGGAAPVGDLLSEKALSALGARLDADRHLGADRLPARPAPRPENPFATSFVTLDRDGSAVACTVTMNNLFGTGRHAPGTGILLAAMPGPGGRGADALGPMLVINEFTREFFFGAGAAGGPAGPTALAGVAARVLVAKEPLEDALAAPRVHHGGAPDRTFHEASLPAETTRALAAKGHALEAAERIGAVNAISCPQGLPPHPDSCVLKTDPRGFGLAAFAD